MSTPTAAPQAKPTPSASLYVGDLLPEVSEVVLFETFSTVGTVSSIRVCRDTHSRRSLGYAYVNFQNVQDAEMALDTLNNTPINGRPCRIMWSQRDPTMRKTGLGNVFIKNLDPKITHKELYDIFSRYGNILSCKVAMNELGESKGYGFVHFEFQKSAEAATKAVNDMRLATKIVYVGPFIPRKVRNQQLETSWTNVYVKDIDPEVTDAQFESAFAAFGKVTSPVIVRKEGQSSFYGFVNFENHEDAVKAVEALNGAKLGNKEIFCCRAQKKQERTMRLKKEWEQTKSTKYQGVNLYVKNIEDEIDEERLKKEFSAYGTVVSHKIMAEDNNSKGFGFVCFSTPEEAMRAIGEMNGRVLAGCTKPLYVALHESKESRRAKLAAQRLASHKTAIPRGAQGQVVPQNIYPGTPVFYPNSGYAYPNMIQPVPRWGPQFPVSYPPNHLPGMVQQRGGGRGPRGGTGRGPNTRPGRNQSPQADEFTLQHLSQFPFDQQKLFLGERLYPLIGQTQPDLAGKITGMFLDSGWSIEELFSLVQDKNKLAEKIEDAVMVLEKAQAEAPTLQSDVDGSNANTQ